MINLKLFWAKVDKTQDCWQWTAYTSAGGYGTLKSKGKQLYAHRVSWEIHNGPIPEGLQINHHCDNPCCVNPDHLFLGTQADNINDMISKGRHVLSYGEDHGQSKLTAEDVKEIRKIYSYGQISQKELGMLFGVSQGVLGKVVNYKTWKHI